MKMLTSAKLWFADRPIRFKFWIGSAFTTALALSMASAVVTYQHAVSLRNGTIEDLEIFAAALANNASAAVAFDDSRAAQSLLDDMAQNPDIVHIEIMQSDGRPLASYTRPNHDRLLGHLHDRGDDRFVDWSGMRLVQPISIQNQSIGELEMHASFERIRRRLGEFVAALAVGAVIAFVVSIAVIYRIGDLIATPLRQLAGLMQMISKADRYDLRASQDSKDEIGDLAAGFNQMIAQIEFRGAALDKELAQRKLVEMELARLAHYDAVTGLPNRHYFNERRRRNLHRRGHVLRPGQFQAGQRHARTRGGRYLVAGSGASPGLGPEKYRYPVSSGWR